MEVNLAAAFLGGVVSFLAPCVLPLIPGLLAYLAGSTLDEAEGKRREIFLNTVFFVLGFSVVFAALGALLNSLLVNVAAEVQTWLSRIGGVIIIIFGLYLARIIKLRFLDREHKFQIKRKFNSRYLTSFMFGLAFAAGWTPCVGPVLGSLLALAASSPGSAFLLLLSYALGLGLPFLLVGIFTGEASNFLTRHAKTLSYANVIFGILLIILGGLIFTERLAALANLELLNKIVTSEPISITEKTSACFTSNLRVPSSVDLTLSEKGNRYPAYQEISTPNGFINKPAFKLADLIGKKVILLDFWTYSCINCQRTTPCLNAWYEEYKDKGLEIVGVHTPEFDFEKDYQNVKEAVEQFGVKFPVILDNDFSTWQSYGNRYWPRKYLIDIDGRVVYDHIGEGAYQETDEAIRKALFERETRLNVDANLDERVVTQAKAPIVSSFRLSPEIYFGSNRNEDLGNGEVGKSGKVDFVLPSEIMRDKLYLNGTWQVSNEWAESTTKDNEIIFKFNAQKVFFVAGASKPTTVKVFIDDVFTEEIKVSDYQLYQLYSGTNTSEHTLRLQILTPGLRAFTFTFG